MKKLTLVFVALFAVSMFTTSCREEGETTEEKMEDVADDMEDVADDVEDTMEEGVDEVQENTGMGGEDDAS